MNLFSSETLIPHITLLCMYVCTCTLFILIFILSWYLECLYAWVRQHKNKQKVKGLATTRNSSCDKKHTYIDTNINDRKNKTTTGCTSVGTYVCKCVCVSVCFVSCFGCPSFLIPCFHYDYFLLSFFIFQFHFILFLFNISFLSLKRQPTLD